MASDTPRSDEDEDRCRECGLTFCSYDLAKTLERELAAAEEKRRADIRKCARLCERRAEQRFEECGTRESDTGATYYSGHRGDEYDTRDEEDASCSEAIMEAFHDCFPERGGVDTEK